ncbi:hypothetical protein HY310_01155 [Candidatus Microgenomates bacterium]|nr:hypothetical protein [Candidatus Microgenomates bacterium]
MDKKLKVSLYLLLFGIVAVYVALTKTPRQTSFSTTSVLGETTNLTLFIEPDDGRSILLSKIGASDHVYGTVYLLSDQEIITAIASKSSYIMLEKTPFGGNGLNQKSKAILGDIVHWSNPTYALTHQKTLIFDNSTVCILNMNLTKSAFEKNREYNICSDNRDDILDSLNIFNADWNRTSYEPTDENLLVSPNNSRGKLTAFIKSAKKSLDIEIEVIADPDMINLISDMSKNIPVRLIVPGKKSVNNPNVPGTTTRYLKSPYPHAKLILVDMEKAYVGSINLTTQSMDQNRELGILVAQPNIIERLNQTFDKDWQSANL